MEQLFASMAKVVAELAPDETARRAIVFAAWRRAAGPAISAKARAVELENARLVVNVGDEAWVPHLEALAPEMLAKLNNLVGHGTVRRIEFRLAATTREF